MKAEVLTGTKSEIADSIMRFPGKIHEVIVVVAEPSLPAAAECDEDMFAEMEPFMAQAGDVDDSREAIYSRMDGE